MKNRYVVVVTKSLNGFVLELVDICKNRTIETAVASELDLRGYGKHCMATALGALYEVVDGLGAKEKEESAAKQPVTNNILGLPEVSNHEL